LRIKSGNHMTLETQKLCEKVYSRDSITGIAQFFAVKMSSGKDVPAIYLCLFEATKERYQEDGRILD